MYTANELTALPLGTVFIIHGRSTEFPAIGDHSIWFVFARGKSVLLSHHGHETEDNDWFANTPITLLGVLDSAEREALSFIYDELDIPHASR